MVLAVRRSSAPAEPFPALFPDPGDLLPDLDELFPEPPGPPAGSDLRGPGGCSAGEMPGAAGLTVTSAARDCGGRVPGPGPAPADRPDLAGAAGSLVTSYMRPWRRRRRCRVAIAWTAAAAAAWAGIGCPGLIHQPASPPGSLPPQVAAPLPAWRHPSAGAAPAAVIAAARARAQHRRQRIKHATAIASGDRTEQHDPPPPPRQRTRHRDKDHPGGPGPGSTRIIRQAVLTAPGQTGDGFATSVAISGNTAVVGASDDGKIGGGGAYVYARTRSGWHRQTRLSAPSTEPAYYAMYVAISGSTIVEGSPDLGAKGIVYVFTRKASGWSLAATLNPPNPGSIFDYGQEVAVSGSTIAVGAETGVFVYARHGSAWVREKKLPISGARTGTMQAMALSGSTLVVSDDTGAFVFSRRGTSWSRQARLTRPAGDQHGMYGASVAVSGSTIVIGNPQDPESGAIAPAAYVYARSGSAWTLQAKLAIPRAAGLADLGGAVAVSGSTVVVTPGMAAGERHPGVAYVFIRSATGWRRQAMIARSHPVSYTFGQSVAVSGTTIMIGAPLYATNYPKGAVDMYARRQ